MLLVPNYTVRLVCFFIMGLCQLKNSASYMWLFSLVMRKDSAVSCGMLNWWDCATLAVITVYFTYVSKDYYPLFFWIIVAATVAHLFLMIWTPESPKFLLAKGRRQDAIKAFNQIGKMNGCQNTIADDAIFTDSGLNQSKSLGDVSALSDVSTLINRSGTASMPVKRQSENFTLAVLIVIANGSFFNSYLTLFSMTSLPG